MDFRQLRYFIAVAEERHFRRAAERLHMSQPPLSQQIRALEDELGVPLLARNRRSVRLTASGEAFLRRARGLLEQAAGAATEAQRIGRGEAGSLAIGFMSAAMLGRLPSLFTAFRAENAAVTIDLVQLPPQEQIEALDAGRIDLGFVAISAGPRHPALERYRLTAHKIWEEELVAAVPPRHRLAERRRIALRALAGERFITLSRAPETGHYDSVVQLCRRSRFRPTIAQEVEQLPAALALIASGYGVSLVPACAIDSWRELVAFLRLEERPRIPVTMIYRADNASPVLTAFRQNLASHHTPSFFQAQAIRYAAMDAAS
jgi:LysR family transcriptional regulator, benzoate and cis,cis-muconate-responsive activator of ben and cat genes